MSYIVCPTCGRLLGDKTLLFENKIKEINNEVLTEEERNEKIMNFINSLKIPLSNYCCKVRLTTAVDIYNIVK